MKISNDLDTTGGVGGSKILHVILETTGSVKRFKILHEFGFTLNIQLKCYYSNVINHPTY